MIVLITIWLISMLYPNDLKIYFNMKFQLQTHDALLNNVHIFINFNKS